MMGLSPAEALNRHDHQNESHKTKQDFAATWSNQVEHWLRANEERKRDAHRGKRGTHEEHLLNHRLSFGHLEHCAGHGSGPQISGIPSGVTAISSILIIWVLVGVSLTFVRARRA